MKWYFTLKKSTHPDIITVHTEGAHRAHHVSPAHNSAEGFYGREIDSVDM